MNSLCRHFKWLILFAAASTAFAEDNSVAVAVYDSILASVKPGQTTIEMGDMRVPVTTVQLWRDRLAGKPVPRSASQTGVNKWTDGVVYYSFNANVTAAQRAHFLDACADWALFANLTFTARTSQANYIMVNRVAGLDGGNSFVGMVGGRQDFNIGPTAWGRGILTHELGHALGLIHEHQRSDRDDYVTILTANTPGGTTDGDFILIPDSASSGPYDFESVMHYRRDTFSTNGGDTIQTKPEYAQFQDIMGQGRLDRWLSRADREGMAAIYGPGPPPSLVVTNTKDSGPGSLRAALYHALDAAIDSPAAAPVITFRIPVTDANFSGGVFTIGPTDRLPGPGPRVIVDGTTQTAFTGNTNANGPEVVLNGASISSVDSYGRGLSLGDHGSTVRGLVINGFSSWGIVITGTNNKVEGCYIGTNAAGTGALANGYGGVAFQGGAKGNVVGGTTAGEGNVISGNDSSGVSISGSGTERNVVAGNLIGTSAAGTSALPNEFWGVNIWSGAGDNMVGGLTGGARNVISGNGYDGVGVNGDGTDGNTVAGNFIGLNAAGTQALANDHTGIQIYEGAANTIVGGAAGGRNFIAGNGGPGIAVSDDGTDGTVIIGNSIGVAPSGGVIANAGNGITILLGALNTVVGGSGTGAANTIRGNDGHGIAIFNTATAGTRISSNSIAGNVGIGINLEGGSQNSARVTANDNDDDDTGPNALQNFPVLSTAVLGAGTVITGSFNGAANTALRFEFFASPASDGQANAEGRYFAGAISGNTNATGSLAISAVLPAAVPAGSYITATATDPAGNTSEFSAARAVTTTDTDGDGMPNVWESANGLLTGSNDALLDADGDGAGNLSEFRAGTDPRDARSVLRVGELTLSAGLPVLSFASIIGKVYRVEYADKLTPGPVWQLFADHLYGTGPPLVIRDNTAGQAPRRFYRVVVATP